jgi:hypothetical protein
MAARREPKRKPGAFVFLASDFYRHPKVISLAHEGHHRAILVAALAFTWCGDNKTDGWVPEYALHSIMARTSDTTHLVAVGLWEPDDGGWWIHSWGEWQDTNDDRARRTERMRSLANLRHHGHPAGVPTNITELRPLGDA